MSMNVHLQKRKWKLVLCTVVKWVKFFFVEGPPRHKNLHTLPNTKLVAVSNANLVFSIYLLPWFIWVKFILLGFIFTFTFCNKGKLVCFSLVSTFCQSMPTWEISVKISTSTKIYAYFFTFESQNMSMNRAVQLNLD